MNANTLNALVNLLRFQHRNKLTMSVNGLSGV